MSLTENRPNAPRIFPQFAIFVTIKNIAPWQKPAMNIGNCGVDSQWYFSSKHIAAAIPTATSHLRFNFPFNHIAQRLPIWEKHIYTAILPQGQA